MTEKTPTRLAEYLRVNHAGERPRPYKDSSLC